LQMRHHDDGKGVRIALQGCPVVLVVQELHDGKFKACPAAPELVAEGRRPPLRLIIRKNG